MCQIKEGPKLCIPVSIKCNQKTEGSLALQKEAGGDPERLLRALVESCDWLKWKCIYISVT